MLSYLLLIPLFIACASGFEGFCYPGESCFPSDTKIRELGSQISGEVYFENDILYEDLNSMYNTWTLKRPKVIVLVKTTMDVQKAVLFARHHKLRVVIKSTGHDFNGRSTADGAFMINLSAMQGININLNSALNSAGEIEIEAGANWISIYEEVDKVNRVVVGGSAHTVGVSGYTLGGGHSPISRTHGLAVDNLLEVEIVTANGSIVVATNSSTHVTDKNGNVTLSNNTDLFWALSGGGGSTFGVATRFVFKLHHPPPKVGQWFLIYPILTKHKENVGQLVLEKFFSMLPNAPRRFGGYVIISGGYSFEFQTTGGVTFFLNYQGDLDSPEVDYFNELVNFLPMHRFVSFLAHDTFLQYEKNVRDPPQATSSLFNALLYEDSCNADCVTFILSTVLSTEWRSVVGYTGTLIGGKMMEFTETATSVHPGFRKGLVSLSGHVSWDSKLVGDPREGIQRAKEIGEKLAKYGDGMYPNEANSEVDNWEVNFWGTNYDRLLKIKKKWDPDNFFTCMQCVGSTTSHGRVITSSIVLLFIFVFLPTLMKNFL